MACGGGDTRSSIHHDPQEEDDKQMVMIIKPLCRIQERIHKKLGLLDGGILDWEVYHLCDVISTKKALKHQGGVTSQLVKLRLASWNLKNATMAGKHPDKIEMIIDTIAWIEPDIIALQEIASSPNELLEYICSRLNEPWVFKFAMVDEHPHEYSAFLWKNCGELQMKNEPPPPMNLGFSRKVQAMEIRIGHFEFTLLNFHFAPRYDDAHRIKNDCDLHELKDLYRRLGEQDFLSRILF